MSDVEEVCGGTQSLSGMSAMKLELLYNIIGGCSVYVRSLCNCTSKLIRSTHGRLARITVLLSLTTWLAVITVC